MDYSKFKLLVSDLDGTLVPYGTNDISLPTKEAIGLLSQSNHLFTIATGRSFEQSRAIVSELGLSVPVIVQTGALIVDPLTEKVLHAQLLSPDIHHQLQDIAGKTAIDHLVLSEDGIYYSDQVGLNCRSWLLQSGEQCTVAKGSIQTASVIKHLFVGHEVEVRKIMKMINETICPIPNLILWPPDPGTVDWFLEVFDPLASKGQALIWLIDKTGVGLEEVIAFGDGFNDLDMLRLAGLGVAMEEAPPEVRAVAGCIIPGPEKEGVAEFIEKHINNGNLQTA